MTPSAKAPIRTAAEGLARDLPGVLVEARRLAAHAPGVHGRRQSGPGEAFWQFRDHRVEDGAKLVDWRRSARGDRLFVREREREAAQSVQLWLDPDPGFAWSGSPDRPPKRDRAAALLLAMAMLLWRGGERVGALGGPLARAGADATERLLDTLLAAATEPPAPQTRAGVILASDGYAPLTAWSQRLETAASQAAFGVVLLVADPIEEDFPFSGRTEFVAPDARDRTIFGRAEEAKTLYGARLADHHRSLSERANRLGFTVVRHRTDRSAAPALSLVLAAMERHQ